jgi:four helix bundle protein
MTNKIISFEDLVVWQKAQELAVKIYHLAELNKFIKNDFTLKDQLKRSAISISDNIAEGFEYNNNPDFYRFLRIAKGSCGELRNKILFIKRLKNIEETIGNELNKEATMLGRQLGELLKKVKLKMASEKKPKTRNP